jgi:hypothetical protein
MPDYKPEGSGRKKGTLNKKTKLLEDGAKTAVQIVREGGMHPVAILMEVSRFLRNVSIALAPPHQDPTALQNAVKSMAATPNGMKQLEAMRRFMETSAAIAYKAAEFGCPKLSRIDYAGEVPGARTENKMIFTLNIDSGQAPGRPVLEGEVTEVGDSETEH